MFDRKALKEVWDYIDVDKDETRIVSRVFFINDLKMYYDFVERLSDLADITIRLSDPQFCKGPDTVPDLRELITFLDANTGKTVLIPNIAEYLRIGEISERNSSFVYSILNRHVHSSNRVWIPIFLGKSNFQSIVGPLDEERFGDYLIDVESVPTDFKVTVYSSAFSNQERITDAVGIREWLSLWDDRKAKTGMSFSTRQIRQITQTNGDYTLSLISDPFEYIKNSLVDANSRIEQGLGTDEQWASLVPFVHPNCSMEEIIPCALNMHSFDPFAVLGNWNNLSKSKKWVFKLWYSLGLNKTSDYISFCISKLSNKNLIDSVECSILECIDNSNFDEWVIQREKMLKILGYNSMSRPFEEAFEAITDNRVKLKILTGKTLKERIKILEIVSNALKEGKQIGEYKTLLQEKYPDLLIYLRPSSYLTGEVDEYMKRYKNNKIADVFSLQLSADAGLVDCLKYDTRGSVLFSLKNSLKSPYFLWFDGLGIEWLDMLVEKIRIIDNQVKPIKVTVGTAALPTITKVNMEKADPETISEKKVDDLDTLSHIKDKSDCNYFSVVVKQFDLIGTIAQRIVETIKSHPNNEVVVTSDHGMSRMAAKGFHETQGVQPPAKSVVANLGRYCELPSDDAYASFANTKKEGKIVAFCTHNHFTVSGYAPGEIHGGATPEEMLVPVIQFARYGRSASASKHIGYRISSSDVFLDKAGDVIISIQTEEEATSLVLEYCGNIINGSSSDRINWIVKLHGLSAGHSYNVHVYPNNLFNPQEEIINVKTRGLVIDDDL